MESQDRAAANPEGLATPSQPTRPVADFAYAGAAGRTRRESFHVTMGDGAIKSIPAHRVVNVGTDPDLREPALAGVLHRFESGEELAIPFVFHDPSARKLALVIPPSLRHRELAERARLIGALEDDPDHPIPPYVRDFAVVIGLDELAEYLALPAPTGSPVEAARREAALRELEQQLTETRVQLRERGQDLDHREALVGRRERELEARETELDERERELVERAREAAALERDLAERGRDLAAGEQSLATRVQELERASRDSVEVVGDDDVEEVVEDADAEGEAEELETAGDDVSLVDEDEVEPVDEGTDAEPPTAQVDVQAVAPDDAEMEAVTPDEVEPVDDADVQAVAPDEVEPVDDADVQAVAPDEVEPVDDGEPELIVSEADVEELAEDDASDGERVDTGELRAIDAAQAPSVDPLATLEDPDARAEAAVALCREGDPEELEAVRRVLPRMTPGEMARVFAALAHRGEPAGDVLIRCLKAPEPYVRHGAALAAGEMGLARAMRPLLELVRSEPEDLWQEAARVLGGYGAGAFGAVRDALASAEQGREERHAYALAALAEGGQGGALRELREAGDGPLAKVAREAMALREVVRSHEEVVRGEAPVDPSDPVRAFSRRFYEVLEGTEA